MNLIGKIIGNRYEILEEAGNGGMATVFKAKDHVLNRFVAVKVLKDEYTTDSDFIKRFNTEAQSAAGLSHANIVSIYDVGFEEENNLYYIVMELVKGKTLKQIIKKDGIISWKWALNIAMQIASALEEAHKNGIVHRDIKPHNIIITEDGIAKVTDFGIAKAVSNSTITAFGTTIGSVHYFSPEQAKGGVTDAKSDLYSLGVVMYEMLTGKVPFDADTPVSVALKHMQEEPKEPIELNGDIPTAINQIVVKAMKKDPTERYQTATEMMKDLAKALKDPDGDFVIIENKDGEYTRVMNAVDDKGKNKKKEKKKGFFAEHPKAKILIFILGLILLFVIVFLITKIALDGGIVKKVSIPNWVNMTLEEVEKNSQNLKLKIEKTEAASSEVEEGRIISQSPEYKAGQKIKEGETIKVVVSKGPETSELNNFVGVKISEVREKAIELGIELIEERKNSNTVEADYVIEQSVPEGTLVKPGDTVTVVVSSGVAKVKVPYVIGMDEGTANATLVNANLKAKVNYISDTEKENGKVLEQSIQSGEETAEGTEIEITVNKFEETKKTVKLILEEVPKVQTDSNTNSTTNTNNSNTVTITVAVNGKTTVNGKSSTIGEKNVDLGTITGTGLQKIEVNIVQGNLTKTIKKEINIDEYDENATWYIKE